MKAANNRERANAQLKFYAVLSLLVGAVVLLSYLAFDKAEKEQCAVASAYEERIRSFIDDMDKTKRLLNEAQSKEWPNTTSSKLNTHIGRFGEKNADSLSIAVYPMLNEMMATLTKKNDFATKNESLKSKVKNLESDLGVCVANSPRLNPCVTYINERDKARTALNAIKTLSDNMENQRTVVLDNTFIEGYYELEQFKDSRRPKLIEKDKVIINAFVQYFRQSNGTIHSYKANSLPQIKVKVSEGK